ncbi:MAG: heavy metal-responsive transcriptional regulator [Nitrospirae bacterium]|nr:heavy metal-responsive transcriptional regulator [Nitrospirota bacterium]MCL5062731.1 heavy metal-responsive transcriptional regulator [Nitrospirota bacterium]MDA8338022.1 heavy metal-responsive transcriptional regulator [Nitrospiraceae bacterium]
MKKFFIGDIAKRFGLNPRTIRYYETIGILPKAGRTESGYRIYTNETVERLDFIIKAKTLGLKLNEIKEILQLHEKGEVPCECTKEFIRKKISEIEDKITSLTELKIRLTELLKLKKYKSIPQFICPIIESEKIS